MKKVIVLVLAVALGHSGVGQATDPKGGCVTASTNTTCKLLDDNHYEVTQYSESGKVKQVGYYLNGRKSGKWTAYDESGAVVSQMNYLKGKKEGKTIVWVPGENIRYEIIYSKDKMISRYAFDNTNDQLLATK